MPSQLSIRGLLSAILFVIASPPAPAQNKARSAPDVILVTLGSTRADRISFLGSQRPALHLTPHLETLSTQSVVFERAYAQAPLTVVSDATILSGTYPQTHHATEFGTPIAPAVPYLPAIFHDHGYNTAAFVGSVELDPKNGFAPGLERGFDLYDAGFSPPASAGNSGQRSAAEIISRTTRWLDTARGPCFLWIHLADPDSARDYAAYDRAVAANDRAVGRLIAALKQDHRYDSALLVVAADHGESLGDHGEARHGIFLYDAVLHVPLLLKLPQSQMAGTRVTGQVRLLDLAPSILEIARVPIPSQMQGQSLLRAAKDGTGETAYARTDFPQQAFGWSPLESWRSGKYLYIRAPHPELYNLAADPDAAHNLALTAKATLSILSAQLDSFDRHLEAGGGKSQESRLTTTDMQKLASLGYVGLESAPSSARALLTGTEPNDHIDTANKIIEAWTMLQHGESTSPSCFLAAASTEPKSFLAQWGLGEALARKGRYADAVEHLRAAIALQPNVAWLHAAMGLSLLQEKNLRAAAIHFQVASHLMPSSVALQMKLADVYKKLGKPDLASHERVQASRQK
jgi:choline-sulfatase